jgi:hypothetical protein
MMIECAECLSDLARLLPPPMSRQKIGMSQRNRNVFFKRAMENIHPTSLLTHDIGHDMPNTKICDLGWTVL